MNFWLIRRSKAQILNTARSAVFFCLPFLLFEPAFYLYLGSKAWLIFCLDLCYILLFIFNLTLGVHYAMGNANASR
jgi:hypothetical protein